MVDEQEQNHNNDDGEAQVNSVLVSSDADQPRASRTSTSGPKRAHPLPPMWLTIVSLVALFFAAPANGQSPMLCDLMDKHSVTYPMPARVTCNVDYDIRDEYRAVTLTTRVLLLYQQRHYRRITPAQICRLQKTTITTHKTLFGHKREQVHNEFKPVSPSECRSMAYEKRCVAGALVLRNNLLQTTNVVRPEYAMIERNYTVENCIVYNAALYEKFDDKNSLETTAGPLPFHCAFEGGECPIIGQLGYVIWSVQAKKQCQYEPWQYIKGQQSDLYWISTKTDMVFTVGVNIDTKIYEFPSGKSTSDIKDCYGQEIARTYDSVFYRFATEAENNELDRKDLWHNGRASAEKIDIGMLDLTKHIEVNNTNVPLPIKWLMNNMTKAQHKLIDVFASRAVVRYMSLAMYWSSCQSYARDLEMMKIQTLSSLTHVESERNLVVTLSWLHRDERIRTFW